MRYEQDRRLVARGFQICVLSCKTFGAPASEKLEEIEVYRVPSFVLPVIEYPLPNLLLLYAWVATLVKRNKIDLVHVEDGAYLTSLLVLLVKSRLRKPVILSMQGFPGFSWVYGSFLVDLIAKVYAFSVGKLVLNAANRLVLAATAFADDAVRLGVPQKKVDVIPRGIDLRVYHPDLNSRNTLRNLLGVKDDETMVLFAGRLVPVKGLKYFVETAKKVLEENGNRRLKFVVAGDGILRSKYQKETSNLRSNIKFIGYRKDMPAVMNATDIFVLSSISEGCPNAVIEAGACAKPVVATDVGAASDIIVAGETGIIVEPRNVDALCDGLRKLLDSGSAEEMGKKAADRIRKLFDWTIVTSRWEKVYRETLKFQS